MRTGQYADRMIGERGKVERAACPRELKRRPLPPAKKQDPKPDSATKKA